MSEDEASPTAVRDPRQTVLNLYATVLAINLVAIGFLALYCYQLGPLVGPGVESSFGFAVALMFLLGALSVHVAEATYRMWPLGRRFHPANPGPFTDASIATFVKVLVVALAVGGIAYLLYGVLT